MIRLNIGCGRTPTPGWTNFDNSPSLLLARLGVLPQLLRAIGLLTASQAEFINFCKGHRIEYADARRRLPLASGSVGVLYTSHMLEHLSRQDAVLFVAEARRLLCRDGVIRIVVPDLLKLARRYVDGESDADGFIAGSQLVGEPPRGAKGALLRWAIGERHHRWMYDGRSLANLLTKHGFVRARSVPPGQTIIPDPGKLDLEERADESVYVEAISPGPR